MKRKIHFKKDVTLEEIRRVLNELEFTLNLDESGNFKASKSLVNLIERHLVEESPPKLNDFGESEDWKKT